MITALDAREEVDRLKKEAREAYLAKFDALYSETLAKLETNIKVSIQNHHCKTHIILHDHEVIEKLEKECIENGYKVKYDEKERTFKVEW